MRKLDTAAVESPRLAVLNLAERQFGAFSRDQALAMGMTKARFETRSRSGEWERVLPGVYRIAGQPMSWECLAVAALLWAGSDACLSHRAAARIHGFRGFEDAGVELTNPKIVRRPSGLLVHASDIPGSQIVRKGPLRATSIERTLIDVAGTSNEKIAEAALDEALRLRMTTLDRIRHLLEGDGRGRKGAKPLRKLVVARDPTGRPSESELERMTLRAIKRSRLPMPDQQKVITDQNGHTARVDFVYVRQQIVIEADSFTHHSDRSDWVRDMRRRNRLTREGWRVYHVTFWDLRDRPRELVEWLYHQLFNMKHVYRA